MIKDEYGRYQLERKEELMAEEALKAESYDAYLESEWWKTIRQYPLNDWDGRCACCGSTGCIQLHHTTYDHKGTAEEIRDLVPLCRNCHKEIHRLIGVASLAKDTSSINGVSLSGLKNLRREFYAKYSVRDRAEDLIATIYAFRIYNELRQVLYGHKWKRTQRQGGLYNGVRNHLFRQITGGDMESPAYELIRYANRVDVESLKRKAENCISYITHIFSKEYLDEIGFYKKSKEDKQC